MPVFSADGRWLAFTASRGGLEPEDLPLERADGALDGERHARAARSASSRRRAATWRGCPRSARSAACSSPATASLVYQELSPDGKTREIKTVVRRRHRRACCGATATTAGGRRPIATSKLLVSPDGKSLAFVSDRTGWIHVYVDARWTRPSESQAQALTSGAFGAGLGSWSPDSRQLAYHHSVAGNQMERFVDVVDVASGRSEPVVTARGVNLDPLFAPDGQSLVFQRTDVENSLDLYVAPSRAARRAGAAQRLDAGRAESRPISSRRRRCRFPSRVDKAPVPATLMLPKNLDKSRKHPAIVWIHGSGSDQNFLGWHPGSYRMYYSVSQYLVQQGYVVLTPDYRGSSGYSRDWATGVHMGLGVNDAADVASGADYLKTLDYVDPDRIGVWGLSYGGYPHAAGDDRDPLLWRCGINVAGVVDWATYGAGYTTPRLGTPVENPEIYRVSAPIYHMEKLARPLLDPARHQRSQRAVPRLAAGDRRAAQAGQAVRDGRLSGRDPLLPPRPHPARRVAAGRGVLRPAPEARPGPVEPLTPAGGGPLQSAGRRLAPGGGGACPSCWCC